MHSVWGGVCLCVYVCVCVSVSQHKLMTADDATAHRHGANLCALTPSVVSRVCMSIAGGKKNE